MPLSVSDKTATQLCVFATRISTHSVSPIHSSIVTFCTGSGRPYVKTLWHHLGVESQGLIFVRGARQVGRGADREAEGPVGRHGWPRGRIFRTI